MYVIGVRAVEMYVMLVEPVLCRLLAKSDLLVLPSYTVSLHCDKLTDLGENSHVKLKEGKTVQAKRQ